MVMNKSKSMTRDSQLPRKDLGTSRSVDELTQQNVEAVSRLEAAAREARTPADRIAEAIAGFCGSMRFVLLHITWFTAWILMNSIPEIPHIDPFPFTFLTLIVSLEAIFLSTFILISQNHETRISDRRSHLDLQLNMLSEQENTTMLAILKAIAAKVGADLSQDPHLQAMSQETQPEKLVEQIAEHEEN